MRRDNYFSGRSCNLSLAGRKQKITPGYLFSMFQRYGSPARGAILQFQAPDANLTDSVQSETINTSDGENDFLFLKQTSRRVHRTGGQLHLHCRDTFTFLIFLMFTPRDRSPPRTTDSMQNAAMSGLQGTRHWTPLTMPRPARLAGGATSQQTHAHACQYMVCAHVYAH